MLTPVGSGGSEADKPLSNPRLKVIQGDVTDQVAVNRVFESAKDISGVVVALGGRASEVGKTMLTDGTKRIINAMKLKGTKRISLVSSIGAGSSFGQAPFFFKVLMFTVLRDTFVDKNNQEALFLSENGIGNVLE